MPPEQKPEPCPLWGGGRAGASAPGAPRLHLFLWGLLCVSPFSRAPSFLQRVRSAYLLILGCPQTVTSLFGAPHMASLVPGFD